MGKLIDADLLKENCKITGSFENNFQCVDLITLGEVIDNQPEAFNIEEIIRQLEKEAVDFSDCISSKDVILARQWNKCISVCKEIIRKGGVK